jgi:hypothetical protein
MLASGDRNIILFNEFNKKSIKLTLHEFNFLFIIYKNYSMKGEKDLFFIDAPIVYR